MVFVIHFYELIEVVAIDMESKLWHRLLKIKYLIIAYKNIIHFIINRQFGDEMSCRGR